VAALPGSARAQTPWSTPDANQHIHSTNSGNVGVGTSSPSSKFQVIAGYDGDGVRVSGSTTGPIDPAFGLFDGSTARGFFGLAEVSGAYSTSAVAGDIVLRADTGRLHLQTGTGSAALTIWGGNVGVGTTSPAAFFHVANASGLGSMRLSGRKAVMSFLDTDAAAGQRQYQWRSEGGVFRMSLVNDTDGGFLKQNILAVTSGGDVGIGTATPDTYGDGATINYLSLQAAGANQHAQLTVAGTGTGNGQIVFGNSTVRRAVIAAVNGSHLLFYVNNADSGTTALEAMRITNGGSVGVGTASPSAKLDVNAGSNTAAAINATGTINATGAITGATVNATYQDVAEWVPSTQKLSAGTVVVLDTERTNHVVGSTKAYDTGVAGVVSAQPGVILGEGGEDKVKVATTGRVRVKVDATRSPIHVGDLLVTSDAEGVAMKSVEVDLGGVKIHRPGTIIGKALEPLASGTGEILVLLSLQ
ncbi:MAG: hypothetical protein ACJ74Q_13870, partial [Pyrinomonadaceae bacterium]